MVPENQLDGPTWEAFKNGDKSAYTAIYRYYYPRLYNYGLNITRNEVLVEDSIQEVFTAFWFNRHKMGAVQTPGSYLFISFRNRLTKSLEQDRGLRVANVEEYFFDIEVSADQVMINTERMYEQRVRLKRALNQLTGRQKEVIFLRFYENLSYEDIASLLQISTKATYKLAARAIAELRKVYREDFASSLLSILQLLALVKFIA
jgi:RNA polymerase sigma factor (sigma-70 family)